jgi:hypothetical protein
VRVAILAPGPSLVTLTELPRPYHFLLAVNRAMDHPLGRVVDYWIALDAWTTPPPLHLPRFGMVTHPDAIAAGQANLVPCPLFDYLALHPRAGRYLDPTLHTMPAALWWADHLGAHEVDVFGCDWAGEEDFRGVVGAGRSPDRWANERRACARVVEVTEMTVTGLPA